MRVLWSKEATINLEEIGDFIADRDRLAANRLVDRILRATTLLASHPMMGRQVGAKGDRQLVIPGTKYIAQYAITDGQCVILAVFHSSRNRSSN